MLLHNFRAFLPTPYAAGRQRSVLRSQSGKVEPFSENASQVRRLITRDKKEFLGNENDILDKYSSEFGVSKDDTAKGAGASPFTSSNTKPNTFGSNPPASPFRSSIEPKGLTPMLGPDPVLKEKQKNPLASITITQVVLFCSFTLIILSMLATYNFVMSTGAIRLAGIE